nr:type II toxin-antitoxin system RelE/ParE family toxin [uncultured Selenomonas sp.]
MQFEVEFYETVDGKSPAIDFLDSLEPKVHAKFVSLLELLETNGNRLRKPYSEHIEDDIFELRCKQGSNIYRIMYFFYYHGKIILTNGFIKKTQKTPKNVIALAKRYREDYIRQMGAKE